MKSRHPIWLFLSFPLLVFWMTRHDPFFWDTVQLASKHAHFFYENNLQPRILPTEIDSGHPPTFGFWLAACWHFLGKTLLVSHFLMLPFLVSIVFLLFKIGEILVGSQRSFWLLPLVLLDPVLFGQMCLVSPDVVLVFSFLLALLGVFRGKNWLLAAAVVSLCLISMRGMMVAGALFLWQIFQTPFVIQEESGRPRSSAGFLLNDKKGRKWIKNYLLGFSAAVGFLVWHFLEVGWVGHHAGSSWSPAFQRVDFQGFLKNFAVLGWRWLDFGRVAEWLVLVFLIFKNRNLAAQKNWLWLAAILTFCLSISALVYQNLSAHRYFLPCFLAFHFVIFQSIVQSNFSEKMKTSLLIFLIAMLAAGNFWKYPHGISMDWDSTAAHLPYHAVRAEMIDFFDSQKIDFQTVGSEFPNLNTGENLLLDGDQRRFSEKNFDQNRHILWSNVFNDFSKSELDRLDSEWRLVKRVERAGIEMRLYSKN